MTVTELITALQQYPGDKEVAYASDTSDGLTIRVTIDDTAEEDNQILLLSGLEVTAELLDL